MVFNDTIKVDLCKPLVRTRAVLSSGDDNANSFGASLYRDGEAVSLAGCVVVGYFVLPDGRTVPIKGTASGNTAIVTLSQACYAYGNGTLAVKVGGTDFDTTVRVIDCYTRMLETDTLIDPGDVVPTLDEVLAKIAAVEAATEDAQIAAENANQAAYFLTVKVEDKLRQIAPPIINTATGDGVVFVSDSSENTFERLSIFGRTTQIGTPSPDNPAELVNIGTKGNIGLMVRGKNLLRNYAQTTTWGGVTFTVNTDGSIKVNGTAENGIYSWVSSSNGDFNLPVGEYVMTGCSHNTTGFYLVDYIIDVDGAYIREFVNSGNPVTISVTDASVKHRVLIYIPGGSTLSDVVFYPMIRLASVTDATYKPYADGGSMTLIPPDEMRGIPVSSGGNYTDETGQQWLCDEIDLARGVYVQRVRRKLLDENVNYGYSEGGGKPFISFALPGAVMTGAYAQQIGLCNRMPFSPYANASAQDVVISSLSTTSTNYGITVAPLGITSVEEWLAYIDTRDIEILYQLAEPEETPLPDDIMSAAMALKSLYPNTTIINDEVAGMAAGYVADTKTYIDQRIAALLNA